MIFICVVGILGACSICFPIFIIMWLIGTGILIIVIVVQVHLGLPSHLFFPQHFPQIILNSTLDCNAQTGSAGSIFCSGSENYSPVSWAGLGVTLGLATVGLIFGIIFFAISRSEDEGGGVGKAGGDYDY